MCVCVCVCVCVCTSVEIKFSLCFLKYSSFTAKDLTICFQAFLQYAVIVQKAALCITTLSSSSKLTYTKLKRQIVQQKHGHLPNIDAACNPKEIYCLYSDLFAGPSGRAV